MVQPYRIEYLVIDVSISCLVHEGSIHKTGREAMVGTVFQADAAMSVFPYDVSTLDSSGLVFV